MSSNAEIPENPNLKRDDRNPNLKINFTLTGLEYTVTSYFQISYAVYPTPYRTILNIVRDPVIYHHIFAC